MLFKAENTQQPSGYMHSAGQALCKCACILLHLFEFCRPADPSQSHNDARLCSPPQNASAGVSRMLLGNKCDIEAKRKVSRETGEKVRCHFSERRLNLCDHAAGLKP